jgi:VWFA-related protein
VRKRVLCIAILSLALMPCSLLLPQTKSNSQDREKSRTVFKLPVNVVVVNATVTDQEGDPVADLTQSDFKIFEDGKLQAIQTFALEYYRPVPAAENANLQKPVLRPAAGSIPETERPRMISIVIDDMNADDISDFPRIIKAVEAFIKDTVIPSDQVAILSGSGRLRFPFSNNRQLLLDEARQILEKLSFNIVERPECPQILDLQAQKIVGGDSQPEYLEAAIQEAMSCLSLDPKDENSRKVAEAAARTTAFRHYSELGYRSRTLLSTLKQHVRSLRHFEASKNVVLFSSGFLFEDLIFELQDVADQALRSGVVLSTIDVRGLYSYSARASERIPATQVNYRQRMFQEDAQVKENPLNQLAVDTGGLYYHNNNDLHGGLQKITNRESCYYVLTYAMPSQKSDGKYHQIKLELARPGLKLSYRRGYYSPKEQLSFERRKREDVMEALQAPGNLNEIPIGLGYNYYQADDTSYAVALLANVSIRGLHFLDEDTRYKNLVSLIVVAFDENDHYIDGIEKTIDFNLTDASYASLLNQGLISKVEFKLPMGRYKIKAVVREGAQGKMGSITKAIEIP